MPTAPPHRLTRAGASYVSVLLGLVLMTIVGSALFTGFSHGMRLARLLRIKTELLNVAQAEMEQARGVSFEQLASHPISRAGVTGEVRVDLIDARRKRISLVVRRPDAPHWPVRLVTDRCL